MKIKSSQDLVEEAKKHIKTIKADEVKSLVDKEQCTLIDLRDIREIWKEGTFKDALHIPRGMLEFWLDPSSKYYKKNKFDNNKKMVLFCALGFRSALANKTLKDMGYQNVVDAEGGFENLKKTGLKIVFKEKK